MRISIFVKTFLMLLISFTLVFLFSMLISQNRFGPMYIEENIEAVKESIILEASTIKNGTKLKDTSLYDLSSETSFIRYCGFTVTEEIGPNFLDDEDILDFVIEVYDRTDVIIEGKLTYYETTNGDIHEINYIYEFGFGDYLIISTKIQSLQNVDLVLNNINRSQSIAVFITIIILSLIISNSISRPLKKINKYAKNISELKFDSDLNIRRKDEFRDLVNSLNDMTDNLKNSYNELNDVNTKLRDDIEYELMQEQKKKQLIYTINHELKTPLAVMKGMVEGMIDGIGRYKDRDKYLNELIPQIEKVENLAKDLTYSLKLEDKLNLDETSHSSSIIDNFSSLDELATQKGKKVYKYIDNSELLITEELLLILVTNVVKNAILYSETPEIRLDGKIIDEYYTIEVKNKGNIKKEDLDKLFESFYRSDNKNEGSGLGLSIVRQICELYHYDYEINNQETFVVAKIKIKIK